MSYEPSGDSGTGITMRTEIERFSPIDDKSGGLLPGFNTLSGMHTASTIARSAIPSNQRLAEKSSHPARRDAIRRTLILTQDIAESMGVYAKADDRMELGLAGFKLNDLLGELWELRSEREDDWGDLLNILQGALAQEEFERFTYEQCCAIHTIIADHLGAGVVGTDDLEQSVKLLRKAGFDPWKGISGTLYSDED